MNAALFRRPSAYLPPAMSLAALLIVVVHVIIYGPVREADEGATAHWWQLLMVAQLPFMGFFLIRWVPRAPRAALAVLALQLVAVLAALAPVYFLHL